MFSLYYQLLFRKLRKEYHKECQQQNFNITHLDNKAQQLALKIYHHYSTKFLKFSSFHCPVGYLATEIYPTGGHTPCLVNQVYSLSDVYKNQPLYFTKLKPSLENNTKTITKLSPICLLDGITHKTRNFTSNLIELYNKIIQYSPKVLFIYIHPQDIFSTCLIGLLKKTTPIKFIFANHASHQINMGMSFSDLILEGMKTTENTTHTKRKLYQTYIIGLQSVNKNETIYYTDTEKNQLRTELGIQENEILTLSGGAAYKFFENNHSPHFELIKRLLKQEPSLKHLALIKFSEEQQKIIDTLFVNEDTLKNRLIILDPTPDYALYFQSADLVIDSFPMSSALTQIDLMRMKVPTIAKINKEKPELSFHEYFPEDYPYMFEHVEDMEKGIIKLLHNKEEQKNMIDKLYTHYLNTFEGNLVKEKLINIINQVNKL